MPIPLSLLDLDRNFAVAQELGPFAEALGYKRYWFGEHPPQPNAEIFVALLAGLTERIRIGTGGVLLRLRNVSQSAANFSFLQTLCGDRLDAGFCNAAAVPAVAQALSEPASVPAPAEFDDRARRWVELLRASQTRPGQEIWSLGTGTSSAARAAAQGLSFAYSLFHQQSVTKSEAFELYRKEFKPSSALAVPQTMLAFAGVCADTEAQAERLLSTHENSFIVPTVSGTPRQCRVQLRALRSQFQPDELIFVDLAPDLETKRASCQLMAEVVQSI